MGNVKKFLPLILLGVGILVLGGVIFAFTRSKSTPSDEEETAKEIPAEERPIVMLVPSSDGHYLKLTIAQIKVKGTASLDYELLYTLPDGRTQGVPGTVKFTGGDVIKDLLLGSESSGKFRYDERVTGGVVNIRFRDGKGKLIGKLTSEFSMQTGVKILQSKDGKFTYDLGKVNKGVFYVTMQAFAEPNPSTVVVYKDGYSVFASK